MTRKRFSEDDILNVFRQIELVLSGGSSVEIAVWANRSYMSLSRWRKRMSD
jgi:hypothetical protein